MGLMNSYPSQNTSEDTHLSIVDTYNTSNHLWDDNHVTQMGLDNSRLLIWGSFLLGLAQLLNETHRTALETTLEATTGTGVNEFDELSDEIFCYIVGT